MFIVLVTLIACEVDLTHWPFLLLVVLITGLYLAGTSGQIVYDGL